MVYWLPEGDLTEFPPLSEADGDGLLAFGGSLSVPNLLLAYRSGIFPWPQRGFPLLWFSPPERGILMFKDIHVPRRLQREMKKWDFELRVNTAFEDVISRCAKSKNRKGQKGTWITPEMVRSYTRLHEAGHALSFEAWQNEKLVGGLYGVWLKDFFAGESMFHSVPDASKFALLECVKWLKLRGLEWMDIQMVTPLLKLFGGKEIPRASYMKILSQRLLRPTPGSKC